MSRNYRVPQFSIMVIASLVVATGVAAQSVSIDHIRGQVGSDTLVTGFPIEIGIRVINPRDSAAWSVHHAFLLYSPSDIPINPIMSINYDAFDSTWLPGTLIVNHTTLAADSVALFALADGPPSTDGLPKGYNDVPYLITIGPFDASVEGGVVCIDTTMYCCGTHKIDMWLWMLGADFPWLGVFPDWQGASCFTISSDCCRGILGNIDGDPSDDISISDITYLADFMFGGGPGFVCPAEADVNGDGQEVPLIDDLTYLVDYMFGGGPVPVACQ